MPLPRQLFDLGVSPECEGMMRLAYQFLAENRDLAFSQEEIGEELGKQEELDEALSTLTRLRAVERRGIGGTYYFTFQQEFDTGTWLSKKHLANQGC